jgi:hypothetical protein
LANPETTLVARGISSNPYQRNGYQGNQSHAREVAMLRQEGHEFLTQVGSGKPMGNYSAVSGFLT